MSETPKDNENLSFVPVKEVSDSVSDAEDKDEVQTDHEEKKEFEEVMDSLCMQCGGSGTTRYMIHKIPYFRELVISSFDCHDDECGEHNNEVTFGGEIQLQGCSFTLEVTEQKDLDRQLIKSDSASVLLPDLEFEIPPDTQKGEISTIEGFLMTAAKNLGMFQEQRLEQDPVTGAKVAEIITELTRRAMGTVFPFSIVVSDPAGNSFVQNLCAPHVDPQLKQVHFHRTREQNAALGLNPDSQEYREPSATNYAAMINGERSFGAAAGQLQEGEATGGKPVSAGDVQKEIEKKTEDIRLGRQEVVSIPDFCCNCHQPGESLTAITDIPHFKEVIIMAFTCAHCGYKSSEVKAGGAVPTYGTEVTLHASSAADLKRDVLKSDSAMVKIPELGLELQCGTLGGQYTTVEGLLQKIESNVRDINPFSYGDSTTLHHSDELSKEKGGVFDKFIDDLQAISSGKQFPFTLTLRDPLGNSFISAHLGSFTPPEADSGLTIADFERTYEENDEFGFNDMNTRDFETGVDYDDDSVRLPDRLTHVHVKGADHPVPFAQGVADGTQGGMYFTSTTRAEEGSGVGNESVKGENAWTSHGPAWGPGEMAAEMGCPDNATSAEGHSGGVILSSRRKFHPRDVGLKFDPHEEFSGRREGFVFRLGGQGVGYYEDKPMTQEELDGGKEEEI